MEDTEKIIDVEKEIRNSKSKFLKSLPGFIIRMISRIVHEDDINHTIYRSRHLEGVPFIIDVMEGWNVSLVVKGEENIPPAGRFIFAANHPVGGIDALSIYCTIFRHYKDVVSPANELLNNIPNLSPLVLGLNVFGKNNREVASKIDRLYASSAQVMIFPSGEVSRRRKGIISDPVWQKSFVTKAVLHKRDIIPVHISGRNSNLFYNVARIREILGIRMYIETMLLPREMMRQKNSTTTVTVGKVIPYNTLTEDLSHHEWAQKIKGIVYSLPHAIS